MTNETVCVQRDELSELLQDGVDDYWITTEDGARIVDILRSALAQPVASEPVTFDWPDYHGQGMGCGLEDRGITDRYEAMRYGWEEAAERYAEIAQAEPLYRHPPAPAIPEGWIPVSERLPDECRANVLLYFKERHAITIGLWSDVFHTWEFHHHVDFDEDQLTHWMPLPAAPQPTEGSTDE